MIKAVIFDMDGLMFDTESAYSVVHQNMSAARGKVFTLEIKASLMGKRSNEVMALLNDCWGKDETVDDLLAEQDIELVKIYNEKVEKLNGLDQLLEFLNKNNIRKVIGTSSRRFLVDVILKKFNLEKEFEFIVSGDMVKHGKPDPEIYNLCLEKLGLDSGSALVLEDSINGVRSGVAAGCFTCAIPSEFTSHENFDIATFTTKSLFDKDLTDFILRK